MLASAHEGLARALIVAGEVEPAGAARDHAQALLDTCPDTEDRRIVQADLDSLR